MAFNFPLPTTSILAFSSSLRCDSHPSLLLSATTQRTVLRTILKQHKRLPLSDQPANLIHILSAINSYLPYLLSLEQALSGRLVNSENIFVALTSEPEIEWRSSIASPPPGRQVPRVKGSGFDYEILFVLATAAYTYCLEARRHLSPFTASNASSRFSTEQRKAAVNGAANALLTANSLYLYAARISEGVPPTSLPATVIDIQVPALTALAELAWASATLLAVVKDDEYLVLAAQSRDASDREWMYKAPDIPKVRAHLFARLCLAAAEHAGKATALLSGGNAREDLVKYAKDLAATARARSCRFFGVDAELAGKMGDALGWLNAGRRALGLPVESSSFANPANKSRFKPSLTAMKTSWSERKERKGLEGTPQLSLDDPGRIEEGLVIQMLWKTWDRSNDMITHEVVTDENTLLQTVPTGREIHSARIWDPPVLGAGELERLRAPADRDEEDIVGDSDRSDDEVEGRGMPGAWDSRAQGSAAAVGRSGTAAGETYY